MPVSKYFYLGSPFIPVYDLDSLVNEIIKKIDDGYFPTAAVCMTLNTMMEFHIEKNILPDLKNITANFGTNTTNLNLLRYGYELPFNSVAITVSYINTGSKQETLDMFFPSKLNKFTEIYRQYFDYNLEIMKDLLQKDATACLLFRYLIEKPFIRGDYFDTGHEFADYVFEEICIAVAQKIASE